MTYFKMVKYTKKVTRYKKVFYTICTECGKTRKSDGSYARQCSSECRQAYFERRKREVRAYNTGYISNMRTRKKQAKLIPTACQPVPPTPLAGSCKDNI